MTSTEQQTEQLLADNSASLTFYIGELRKAADETRAQEALVRQLKNELSFALQGMKLINDSDSLKRARSLARCTIASMPDSILKLIKTN